jgi:membrane associated rhomboid family serine protease
MGPMPASRFEDASNTPRPWDGAPPPETPPEPLREPMFNAPWPAIAVAALIVGGYALQRFVPDATLGALAFAPADLTAGRPWTAITALFLHFNWSHALMNGAFGLAFATPVARFFGMRPAGVATFFGFYLLTGVLANLGFAALHWGSTGALIGASGAVSGLMGATARLLGGHGRVGRILAPETLSFGGSLLVVNLLIAVFGSAVVPGAGGAGIAWEAHLAGFVAGLLLIGPFSRLAWR